MTNWMLMLATLPTASGSARVRLWRSAKALGCGALTDGTYLLPGTEAHARALDVLAAQVREEGGQAWVLGIAARAPEDDEAIRKLFDRAPEWDTFAAELADARRELASGSRNDVARTLRRLKRSYETLAAIDYFPGDASARARASWLDYMASAEAVLSPGEPQAQAGAVRSRSAREYRGRTWATRRDLWVDRVASAWLVRRFIDPRARFLWLEKPGDCPQEALGFDFDGAEFTHIDGRVTFEVIAAAFGLESDPGIARLGALVHALDAGGAPPPEARGFEAILAGARQRCNGDDDALLKEMSSVLDSLHAHYGEDPDAR